MFKFSSFNNMFAIEHCYYLLCVILIFICLLQELSDIRPTPLHNVMPAQLHNMVPMFTNVQSTHFQNVASTHLHDNRLRR